MNSRKEAEEKQKGEDNEEKIKDEDGDNGFNDSNYWKLQLNFEEDDLIKELFMGKERRMSGDKLK